MRSVAGSSSRRAEAHCSRPNTRTAATGDGSGLAEFSAAADSGHRSLTRSKAAPMSAREALSASSPSSQSQIIPRQNWFSSTSLIQPPCPHWQRRGYVTFRKLARTNPSHSTEWYPKLVPLGPLGFNSPNIAQRHALHVERTAEKAVMLSDRV